MKSTLYPYTMRECIVDYLTAMGARTFVQIRNEVRPQCSDYDPNALVCLLAQMATDGSVGMDTRRFAVTTRDLLDAEIREHNLTLQRIRDSEQHEKLFGPMPTSLDDSDKPA